MKRITTRTPSKRDWRAPLPAFSLQLFLAATAAAALPGRDPALEPTTSAAASWAARSLTAGMPATIPDGPYWADEFGWPGTDGTVFAAAYYQDRLVIGGNFSEAGGTPADGLALWNGVTWRSLGPVRGPTPFSSLIAAMTIFEGDLVVAGNFQSIGGVVAENIARWNGSTWAPVGSGLPGAVQSLTVQDGTLVAGGEFLNIQLSHVARWNGSLWQPLGAGTNGIVMALETLGGDLYAGGDFTTAGGAPANHVARWDGAAWHALAEGTSGGIGGRVRSLAAYQGGMVVAGEFTIAGTVASPGIAAWDGSAWRTLAGGVGNTNFYVYALRRLGDRLVAGGHFERAGPVAAEGIASWDGANWSILPSRSGRRGASGELPSILALAEQGGGLAVAGHFDMTPDGMAIGVARWDSTGWTPFGEGLSDGYYLSYVNTFAAWNGMLAVAGRLAHRQNTPLPSVDLRAWDGHRMQTIEWRVSALQTPNINALLEYRGDLVAAGTFTEVGGVPAPYLARYDGAAWHPLAADLDAPVQACVVYRGDLVIGGEFTIAGGVSAARVARWDGTGWHALGSGLNAPVGVLAVIGADLVAGGVFTEAGGVPVRSIARWDGAAWESLGSGANGTVSALASFGGKLIAGGWFTEAGGVAAGRIAAWDGRRWSPLGGGFDQPVNALLATGNLLLAGGAFEHVGGTQARGLASWDGATWRELGGGVTSPTQSFAQVITLGMFEDHLFVGGEFEAAGGVPSYNIARWDTTLASETPPPPVALQLQAAYPNPSKGPIAIRFALPADGSVRLTIHDVLGRLVASLAGSARAAEPQVLVWDGRDDRGRRAPSGVYRARLEFAGQVRSRTLVIIR